MNVGYSVERVLREQAEADQGVISYQTFVNVLETVGNEMQQNDTWQQVGWS